MGVSHTSSRSGRKGMCVHALPPSWEAAEEGTVCSGLCLFDLENDPFVKEDGGGHGPN